MKEEEIRPIAENYVEEYCHCSDGEYTDGDLVCAGIGTALIVSRQLEKKIAELKKSCDETQELLDKQIEATYKLVEENTELKEKLTAIRNAKDKYDMSKDKSIIKAFGAEYSLFCDLERILEDWLEDDELTTAKEILKSLYFIIESRIDYKNNIEIADEMWRAEQFIKE